MKRVLVVLALTLSALASTGIGVGWAAFRTDAGRKALTAYLASALDNVVNGDVQVGSIGGSILEGMVVEDLVITDTAGVLVARIPRLAARYRLSDLISRRIVLGQVILTDPHINLLQRSPDGPLNVEDVFRLGGGDGGGGRPLLVAFEDAEIHRANIVISTPSDPPKAEDRHTTEETEWGWMRVRRVNNLSTRLDYVRLSSPREPGIRLDVRNLTAVANDPALDLRGLEGRIDLHGDSVHVNLESAELPASRASVFGFLKWPTGKVELGLNVTADRFAVDDVRTFARRLPWGMSGSGQIRLASPNPDSLAVTLDPVRLAADGGVISGRVGITVSGGQLVQLRDTDLRLDSLTIDRVRPLLDTIPFDGRITGRLAANGPTNLLNTEIDWTFLDEAVDSTPVSYIRGAGFLALGGVGTTLLNFQVDTARIDLATLRELFPSIELLGHVGGSGNVTGLWRNAELSGRLWHQYDSMPTSRASGTLRFDTRTDTLGVYAELGLDTLHLPSMRPSYPALPPAGAVVGHLSLDGPLNAMNFVAEMDGRAGAASTTGQLVFGDTRLAVRDLAGEFSEFDPSFFYPNLLPMELYGRVEGYAVRDSGMAGQSLFDVSLDESWVAGSPLDSGRSRVGVEDSTLLTESVVWGPGMVGELDGDFGLSANRTGNLLVSGRVDSLGSIAAMLDYFAPDGANDSLFMNLVGRGRVDATLSGSVESFTSELTIDVPEAYSEGGVAEGVRAQALIGTAFSSDFDVAGSVDSLEVGAWVFSDLGLDLKGTRGQADWSGYARMGLDGSVVGWGKSFWDGRVLVLPLDSMALLLPENIWMLNHASVVSVSDSGLLFSQFTLESVNDPRSPDAVACPDRRPAITLEGLFPTNGSAEMIAQLQAVPAQDLWGLVQENPTRVAGDVCGRIVLGGTAPAPLVTSSMNIHDGRIGNVSIPRSTGQLRYEDLRLTGDFEVRDDGELLTEIEFELPVDLALQEVEERRVPGPLSVTVRADSVDMSIVELLTTTVVDAAGTLYADFGVRGTWESPLLTGTASVVNATARLPNLGVTHERLNGGVHLTGDSILIDSLRLYSGNGFLRVGGHVRLDGMREPILALRFGANDFHTANIPGLVDFSTSGAVSLNGPILAATLTGSGTVTEGVLQFADLIEKQVINLNDTLYTQLLDADLRALIQREGLGADFENRFLDSLTIDSLQLQMGRSVWLRSSQANVQLDGRLSVNKVADNYRYDGTLNTVRGSYRLPLLGASKDFAVTDGAVQYFGTPDLNAALDINAQHVVRTVQRDEIVVFVNIGGTLNDPIVNLSTDREPELPTSEIISYLLVGAPRVEAAIGNSSQGSSGIDLGVNAIVGQVSSEVERALISDLGVPIDYLRVRTDFSTSAAGSTRTEFSFGRRFGEQWFIIATPSVCWGESERHIGARAEYRFADEWSWSLSTGPGTSCGTRASSAVRNRYQWGVDLTWQRRY